MDPTTLINRPVDVAVTFEVLGKSSPVATPRIMRYNGQDITFTKLGMRHPTAKGKRMIHVFDISDGTNDYRLEFDAQRLTWQLVAIIPGATP